MTIDFKHILSVIISFLPFLGLASAGTVEKGEKAILVQVGTRLLEAAILGGIILYANIKVFEEKIITNRVTITELKKECAVRENALDTLREDIAGLKGMFGQYEFLYKRDSHTHKNNN